MTGRHPLVRVGLVFALGLAVAVLLPRLFSDPLEEAAQEAPAPMQDLPTDPVARVLLSAIWSPSAGYEYVRPLLSCLEEALGGPVKLVQRPTYAEANARIASGDIDIALICSGATGDASVRSHMDAAYRLRFARGDTYRSVIVVLASDMASDLEGLEGSTFAWVDVDSLTGFAAPHAELERRGLDPEHFFAKGTFTHGHDRSIRAVATGLVRAAAVDEEVLLRSPSRDLLRVVWRSQDFPAPPLVIRRDRPELRAALSALANRAECFEPLGAVGLEPAMWSDYDVVAAITSDEAP